MTSAEQPNTHRIELTPYIGINHKRGLLGWQLEASIGYESRILRGETTYPPFIIIKEKLHHSLGEFNLQALTEKAFGHAYAEQQRLPEDRQSFVKVIQAEKVEWDSPSTVRCFSLGKAYRGVMG